MMDLATIGHWRCRVSRMPLPVCRAYMVGDSVTMDGNALIEFPVRVEPVTGCSSSFSKSLYNITNLSISSYLSTM